MNSKLMTHSQSAHSNSKIPIASRIEKTPIMSSSTRLVLADRLSSLRDLLSSADEHLVVFFKGREPQHSKQTTLLAREKRDLREELGFDRSENGVWNKPTSPQFSVSFSLFSPRSQRS